MKAYAMVWVNKSAKVKTVTLYLSGDGLTSNMELSPEDALRLSRELTTAVDSIPRVVSAGDLGLEAA